VLKPLQDVLEAKPGKSQIEEVLLLGGSTLVPKVQEGAGERLFGGKEPSMGVNPERPWPWCYTQLQP